MQKQNNTHMYTHTYRTQYTTANPDIENVCTCLAMFQHHMSRNPHTLCGHPDVLLGYILNNVKEARKYGRYTRNTLVYLKHLYFYEILLVK